MMIVVDDKAKAIKNADILRLECKQRLQEWADNAIRERELIEGIKDAFMKGFINGLADFKNNYKDDFEEIKQGILKDAEQIGALCSVRYLLSIGFEKEDIARATDFSLEEIETLE